MYLAYRSGRRHYLRNRGNDAARATSEPEIPCLWSDEFGSQVASCSSGRDFAAQHGQFVDKRAAQLQKAKPLRRAELLPLALKPGPPDQLHAEFAVQVREAGLRLHADHAEIDPVTGKRVSFGLVRMANIDPLFDVAKALFALGAPDDARIHLCVYHARFPLLQRSAIEHLLDTSFNRRGDGQAVYRQPAIRTVLDAYPEQNQLFVVLASPVCEVGRDWDTDWAVAEPSSLRSLIQLAGRVQRHRGKAPERPNLLVFDHNLRHFRQGQQDRTAFVRPGFELLGQGERARRFQLDSHSLQALLADAEYQTINALPRIRPRASNDWQPRHRLSDLEQARTGCSMLPLQRATNERLPPIEPDQSFLAWQFPNAALTGVLPQQQPFRDDSMRRTRLAFLPDDEEEALQLQRVEDDPGKRGSNLYIPIERALRHDVQLPSGLAITTWGNFELMALLAEQAERLDLPLRACAERFATVDVPASEQGWSYHPVLGFRKKL
jgi:CRISPR-associated endonuclease/helicase Cas3